VTVTAPVLSTLMLRWWCEAAHAIDRAMVRLPLLRKVKEEPVPVRLAASVLTHSRYRRRPRG